MFDVRTSLQAMLAAAALTVAASCCLHCSRQAPPPTAAAEQATTAKKEAPRERATARTAAGPVAAEKKELDEEGGDEGGGARTSGAPAPEPTMEPTVDEPRAAATGGRRGEATRGDEDAKEATLAGGSDRAIRSKARLAVSRGPRAEKARPAPAVPPGQPAPVPAMRAGALRLTGAKNASYKVRYTPSAGLGVPGLQRALRGRKVGAEVKPFAQTIGQGGAGQQDVEQGGEIVALAIALQLQRGGWIVDMLDKASLRAGMSVPSGAPRALARRFLVTGEVSFSVGSREARLHGTVRFSAGGQQVAEVGARTAAPLPRSGPRSTRYAQAASAALRAFVRDVIRDPGLASRLVAHVAR